MKRFALLVLLNGALLTGCQKEDTARPAEPAHSLSRSIRFPASGIRLDTAYATDGIRLEAFVYPGSQGAPTLQLHFGGSGQKDEVRVDIPVNQLRTGRVGAYEFRHVGPAPAYGEVGDATARIGFYPLPNYLVLFGGNNFARGFFTITEYDATRHLLSGHFTYGETWYGGLPIATYPAGTQEVELTGTFEQVPVIE